MARIKKFAPEQKLSSFQTFLVDENPNSDYFRITEFKDTFTGGKNGFLIEGSEYLKESTEIKIEILDVNGEPVYFEPGNGIPEYYEGISKLVAVYIYEDTPIGLGKITVLGELKEYDDSGVKRKIPTEWEGSYNVKWERTFQINKNLSNEDRVRFYRRPQVGIDEIVKPIFNKTPQTITQTGQVDGLPLIPTENTQLSNFSLPTSYRLKVTDETYWTGSVLGQQIQFSGLDYSPIVTDIVNKQEILVDPPYTESDLVKGFSSENYSVSFPYIEGAVDLATALTGSFAKINITNMKTFVGDAARVKVFRKSVSQLTDFEFVQEIQLESNELLRDLESVESTETFYGNLSQNYIDNYWLTSSNDLDTTFNQDFLYNSIELDNTADTPQYFFTSQSLGVTKDVEYNLSFNVRKRANTSSDDYLKVYLSGSFNDSPTSQTIANIGSSNELKQKTSISENIVANDISESKLYFEVKGNDWLINDISLRAAEETSFSPDEITFIQSVPKTLAEETFDFRFEFYDINNNYIPVLVEETKTFTGGNLNLFTKELTLTPNQLYFAFDSASAPANPLPPLNIFIDVEKRVITGSVTFTSGAYDEFGELLSSSQYNGGVFPGLLTDRDKDIVKLNVSDFTGSRDDITVQYIEYTGEVEGVTDSFVITRVQDGKGGVNFEIKPFRGTIIKNKDDKELEIQAIRIDGINEITLKDNLPQVGFSDAKLRVLSSSIDESTLEESGSYILLSEAASTKFIKGLNPGLTGSGEIDYNARFNRDSIDGELTVFLMDNATSESILTSIILTDLQDGLDSGFVTFDADVFTINPRTQKQFVPQFSSVTGSFYKRGTKANPVSASIEVFPSMSINPDFVPEYWMYFVSHSKDESIEVTAFDENGIVVTNGELGSYVGLPASQSKQLLVNFTYTEPITSASVQVDHIFTIVPEGKPGDETVLFEVNPQIVNLKSDSRGNVNDFKQSITDISLRQGSLRLAFTGSGEPGTFTIASESISSQNINVGLLHLTSSFGVDYTASLIVSESSNLTQLSGSINYPLEIRPYFTSSVYTQSFTQNFTKTLDGPPPIEVILTPTAVTLNADEVEFVPDYGNARTTVTVKEGSDNLINTASGDPGTFTVESVDTSNIRIISSSNVEGTVSASFDFERFDYPFLSASAVYNINVFPFSLGPGHEYTSSIFERTQTFVKSVAPSAARSVELNATTTTVTYDGDGSRTSPSAPIVLTATAYNTSGSVYYGFYRDGYVWSPFSQLNTLTLSSGDETERGGSVTWEVRIKDGGNTADVVATDTVTISGISDGANNYNVQLDNPSVTLTVDIDGGTTKTNSGAVIRALKGSTSLTHVTSYAFSDYVYDELGVFLGNIGQYSASVHSISPYLEQNDTFSGNPAQIGDITDWNSPFDNPNGAIVYKVDIENGRATYFLSQSFAASFEGKTGPGVVVRGEWTGSIDYIFDIESKRRDAVVYKYDNNGVEETHYFGTTQTLTPNKRLPYDPATGITDEPEYDGTQTEGDIDDFGWEYLGQQDFFVAAKIGIFEESFVKETINVGIPSDGYSVNPQISIVGGTNEPYISIGQGTQGYGQQGIFLGVTEDGGPNGTAGTTGLISVEDDTGDAYFRWDGYGLEIKSDDVLIETDNLTIDSQNEKISLGQGTQGFQEEGIFIGNDGSDYKLSLTGTPVGGEYNALEWNGSTLTLRGALRQTAAGVVEPSLRGTWAAGTTYYPNDTVQYLGETWSSNTQHTSTDDTDSGTGRPGSGPWTIAAGAGKGVNLIAGSYVISYDADGNNPSPSGTMTLTANSSNFVDGYFKFTGGGGVFTDETTFTDGTGANTDTATFTIPTTYFSTPLQFRVGVAEGDQTEKVSDTITIVAVQPGADSSPMFSIATISGGTQIKNGSGQIELQAQQLDSTGLTNLSSGDIKIYKDDSSLLNASMSGVAGDEYNPTIDENAIDGTLTLELRDSSDDSVLDTITLLDVTDGLGGGSFISPNLKTTRDPSDNSYTPSFLSITASFFSTNGTEYTKAVRITPNFDGGSDFMFFDNNPSEHTDSEITLTLDDGDGTTFSGTGIGNKLQTKDVVVTAEFNDPISGQSNKIVETVYIISDGVDGNDGLTVVNTNQAHTLPAANDGVVSSFVNSGTTIQLYEGATQLDYDASGTTAGHFTVATSLNPALGYKFENLGEGEGVTGAADAFADYPGSVITLYGSEPILDDNTTLYTNVGQTNTFDGEDKYYSDGDTVVRINGSGVVTAQSGYTSTSPNSVELNVVTLATLPDGTSDGNDCVILDHTAMDDNEDSATITYTLTGQRLDGTAFSISTTQTLTKSKAGNAGTNGETGASVNIIFIRNATQPSTPSPSSGVPSGWADSPPSGTALLWAAQGTKGVGDTNFTWGTPYQVEGTAVAEITIYRLNSNAGNSGGSYNFTTSTLTPPTNWSATVPSLTSDGDIVYAANGLFSGAPTETAATTTWSTPVVYAQRTDGTSGVNGTSGIDGSPGEAAGIVYAGEWKLTLPDGSTPNLSDKVVYLGEDDLKYVVKYTSGGSNYWVCATTHRYCGTSTGGNVVGDVVLYLGYYYIANQSTADDPQGDPSAWDELGTLAEMRPGGTPLNGYTLWESFGAEFTSVATDILFAQDVYADKTVNIGSNDGSPVIALNADDANSNANPRIQIGQDVVGGDGFLDEGIYLGYSGSAPVLSMVTGSSFFAYSNGNISLSDANFLGSGSVIEGSAIRVGETSPGSNEYAFLVDTLGNMTAASGSFQGTVTAIGGNIGSWEITNEALSSQRISLDAIENQITVADTSNTVRFNANSETVLPTIAVGSGYSEAMSTTQITRSDFGVTGSLQEGIVEWIDFIPVASGTGFYPTVSGKHKVSFTYDNGLATNVQATGFGSFNGLQLQLVISTSSTAGGVTNGNIIKFGGQTNITAYGYDEGGGGPGIESVVGDTKIILSDGSIKLAREINNDDILLAWNESEQMYSPADISQIRSRTVNSIFRVRVGGKEIDVSDSHGFWLDGGDEIKVQDIIVGETQIYIKNNNSIELKTVESVEEIFGEYDVYTFSVPEFVNYISNDIISHNPLGDGFPVEEITYQSAPHTYTISNVDLTAGTTYYVYMRARNTYYVLDDSSGYRIDTFIRMNNNPVTISPLSAGVIVNGGGFQSVVDSDNYFRFRTDSDGDPYQTDLKGGLGIDYLYASSTDTAVVGNNTAYLKKSVPWVVKGFARIDHTANADTTPSSTSEASFDVDVGFSSVTVSTSIQGFYNVAYEETYTNKFPTVIATAGIGSSYAGIDGATAKDAAKVSIGIGSYTETNVYIYTMDQVQDDLENVRHMGLILLA